MKLIKIYAHGFKSFADPITLSFDGGLTAIVGPNGSGKSNINDAVKWVLGEASSKQLRGSKMLDVIFSGSKTAKEMERAQVSLTFDNSDNEIEHLGKEFTISRVIDRNKDGNEYYINNEIAKAKDIKEIAMRSGIGKSSLAIISQGTVSKIAENSPIERRAIFEEAAGVSLHKARKIEAQASLDRIQIDIDKIELKLNNSKKQLEKLEKQSSKAKIYVEKAEELKQIEIALLVEDITSSLKTIELVSDELDAVEKSKEQLRTKILNSEDIIYKKNSINSQLNQKIEHLREELKQIDKRIRQVEITEASMQENRKMILEGHSSANIQDIIKALKEEIAFKSKEKEIKVSQISAFEEKEKELKELLKSKQETENNILHSINELNNKKTIANSKILSLQEDVKNRTNLSRGTKAIIDSKYIFKGIKGLVKDLMSFESKYQDAMAVILQGSYQNIVVDNSQTAVACVNFLKKNNAGRATFIPLSSISPKFIRKEHEYIIDGLEGFVDIASNLAKVSPEFSLLPKSLLGDILVADTIENATKISDILDKRYTIVTLDGDIVRARGVIQGGEKFINKIFGHEEELEKLNSYINIANKKIQLLNEQLNDVKIEIESLVTDIFSYKEKISTSKIQNELIDNAITSAKSKFSQITSEELKIDGVKLENIDELRILKEDFEAQIDSFVKQVSLNSTSINDEFIIKTQDEAKLRNIEKQFYSKTTLKDRANNILKISNERLNSYYKITYELAREQFSLSMEIELARKITKSLKSEINDLGNVNLDSINEFETVQNEYSLLLQQYEEISSTKAKLEEAKANLDSIIINKLSQVVEKVDKEINEVFSSMFGGGSARVKFSDPNNILESGIDIEAQPPGKTVKNLRLFSGGEKSIIAISLLFAIIKWKPMPLCILDEVEAALDETNVIRYVNYLQKLKKDTQFLVITHRHGTMANVDNLIGATMQNRGITTFFSVSLDQAQNIISQEK
ncbi:AAA family ATPase [Mycoplasma phocimorsus]|uniref:AAA family ATPase n=1 Tax=Mycoplasma phocimorsus TaxID=3045839 RepID=UPI0024BFB4F0|nr:AAA family ATPase [Mycoplasma phocimorsus]MDJ1646333.1 AAA family ATPase [Mycoplasma phocimorsus]MDJ1647256.1 AAA family ATPase [Mycoplasma phocimorsus]MDJ1648388.1 AAA family ATPase [Mycoplasma phocimorsus]